MTLLVSARGSLIYETWMMKVEHKLKSDKTEMRMIRWTCAWFTLKDKKCQAERITGIEISHFGDEEWKTALFGHRLDQMLYNNGDRMN